ncbi:MAG: hypothetical protein NW223_15185 [Hyphomicrobiaceae bacterium]|nr:hypothetical protein [Hyphomicrobiaceae bacterium]
MQILDIFLRLAGAFYIFAGIVLARSIMTARLIDQAIAAIALEPPDPRERRKERYGLILALVTFASGLCLACLARSAVPLFLLGSALQAAYLFWLAPRFVDAPGDAASGGRRQSTNALVLYAAMTALVVWSHHKGRLQDWSEMDDAVRIAAALGLAGFIGMVAWTYARMRLR